MPDMLEDAVRSVLASAPDVDVYVVDNGGQATGLLGAAEHDDRALLDAVEVIVTGQNGGYAAGMNAGIDAALTAGADVVVLLNDDVRVDRGWLDPLVAELERRPDVGAVQPLLLHEDTSIVNSAGVELDRFGAGSDILRDRPMADVGDEPYEVDAFTGGAVAIRREFFADVGRFDERFFLYYEDVELARRGRRTQRPWRYVVVPGSRVWHRGSASAVALGDDVRRLQERNRLWSSAMCGSISEIGRGLWLSVRRLRHAPKRAHRRALVEGVAGIPVRLAERVRRRPPRLLRGIAGRVRSFGAQRAAARVQGTPGVNVVGYHHISSGLGSNARELSAALVAAGVPVIEIDNDLSTSPRRRPARPVPMEVHDTTIAIVTAFEFDSFCARYPHLTGPGKRMIGYWVWELEDVPDQHRASVSLVDEIWTPTTFVQDAYRRAVNGRVPVRLAPFRMEEPPVDPDDVEHWRTGWGSDVVFVVSFDYLSIVERKNPLGAIAAFRAAFDARSLPVRLVVKSINGGQRLDDMAAVAAACGDDQRIEMLDEHLDDAQHHALLASADCLVSLHRSEGYGLHPAIAMWLGTAVIATRYSGVVDFMDDSCAAMVDAELIPVENGQGIYPETAHWADPDLAQAAAHMVRLASDPGHRAELAERGHRRIADQPTPSQFGEAYAAVLRSPPSRRTAGPSTAETTSETTTATGAMDEPFFAGLDAARGAVATVRRVAKSGRRGLAWPDTARR